MIGTRLSDRYEVVGELGRGGMGVVYRARDPLLNREVAVKLIPPTLLNPQAEERFFREAQVVAQMDHPAIVSIFDIGRHDGSLFFLMPVVRGTNLRQFLREKPRSLGDVIEIGIQVADALEYSHSRGIIHRDIKPENVMIEEHEGTIRVRVMDFGLAKASSENRLTKTGTLIGTVTYFSPEQVIAKDVDARSDVYALGTVLYECIVGEPPFSGETQAVLYRVVHEHPRSLRLISNSVNEELDDIVLRALAKDPQKRWARAGDLAEALRRYQSRFTDGELFKSVVLVDAATAQFRAPAGSPLIGRDKPLAELQHRLNAAVDGECQFVVVGGEPGIGKTRLLEEVENLARARKIRVLHGRFVEQDRDLSYQGFCDIIQEYFRSKSPQSGEVPDFSDLAPDLAAIFPVLGEISEIRNSSSSGVVDPRRAEDRTYVYELLARTLIRIGNSSPLLLVLENLHGADTSIDALRYVVRRLSATPTMIAGTYRHTEVDKRHPLVKMLEGFAGDPHFASVVLSPLSSSEHRKLIETLVGSPNLATGLAEQLYEATEANPFFTKELVRAFIDSGGIAKDQSGAWTLSGEVSSAEGLPTTIQQAVEQRVVRLPDDLREVLSVASVLGRSFEYRDLEALIESRGDPGDSVDKLVSEGLLEEERESRGDRFAFSSGIVRDVLYNGLSRRKRKSLHRRYGEILEKRFGLRIDRVLPQLVHHFSEGDEPEKTVQYGMQLARKAIESFSTEEAIHACQRTMEFLTDEEWGGSRVLEGECRILLATALRHNGAIDQSLREIEAAIIILEREKADALLTSAYRLAAEAAWEGRRAEEARRWLAPAIDHARSNGDTAALRALLSLAATVANLRGAYDEAKNYLAELETFSAAKAEETPVVRGGTMSVGLANPVSATRPHEIALDEETEVLGIVFEPLVTTDEQGNFVPLLAEKLEMGSEGKSLHIWLRSGVQFHDGTLLNAETVKHSFERAIRDRATTSAGVAVIRGATELKSGATESLEGIRVLNDLELEIELTDPLPIYPSLLTDIAISISLEADGDGVGTGPFRLSSRTQNRVVLERSENYWRGEPAPLERIEFRAGMSAADIARGLRSGELDIGRDLLQSDLDEIMRDPRFRGRIVEAPKKNILFVGFNNFQGACANVDIRRALAQSIRQDDLVWRALGRLAQPAVCFIPPGILAHDAGRRRAYLSHEDAAALVRKATGGERLRIRVSLHPIFQDRYRPVISAVFEVWNDIGVDLDVVTHSMDEYLATWTRNDAIDVVFARWNADYDDPDNFTHSLFHSQNGIFAKYFASPQTDELFDIARTEPKAAVREQHYRKFESYVSENASILPLFHEINYRVLGSSVGNLQLRSNAPYVNYAQIQREAARAESPSVVVTSGVLTVPIAEDLTTVDPANASTVERGEVVGVFFETLTRCGEGARIVPWLASEFRAEDGGRRYRFKLRDDVLFHDGRRLTARDVRYSWERLLSRGDFLLSPIKGAEALIAGKSKDLTGFRILSAREFIVELEKPLAFFPALISHGSASILREGTEEVTGNWKTNIVGTGPFRVVMFEPKQSIELERNPHYWRAGLPRSERLFFRLGMTPEQIKSEFLEGRLTIASELPPADVEALRHDSRFASGYREVPRMSVYGVAFNIKKGPLTDVELRREIVRGIDFAAIAKRTLGRLILPAYGLIPPGLLGYSPPSGVPQRAAGESRKLDIELEALIHPMFFSQYGAFMREVMSVLEQRGVRLKVLNRSVTDFMELAVASAGDLRIGRWVGDYPDTDTFMNGMLHSQAGSFGRACGTPALDALIEQGRTEPDPAARHTIYRQIEDTCARDVLAVPFFHEQNYRFAAPGVEGLVLNFALPEVNYERLMVRK